MNLMLMSYLRLSLNLPFLMSEIFLNMALALVSFFTTGTGDLFFVLNGTSMSSVLIA